MTNNVADININGSEAKPGVAIDGTPSGALATAHKEGDGEQVQAGAPLFDQKFIDLLVSAEKKMQEIDDRRAELNASKAEVMAKLVNEGLNKDAVKAAIKYFRTPEDKRTNFDLSYAYARKAFGTPLQDDLFVASAQRQVDNYAKSKH